MTALLGWFWWLLFPVRKQHAIDSLRMAFPDADPAGLRHTVGAVAWSYVQLCLRLRARLLAPPTLQTPGILLGAHGVSWDVALISLACQVPITIFVKTPSNPLAAAAIRWLRGQADLELLPPDGSMADAYAAAERGRMVMFVQDQRHNRGISAPFLGRPAKTSAGFASMLWRTRLPVYGVWPHMRDGRHQVLVEPLHFDIPDDRAQAIQHLTEASQRWVAGRIAEDPTAWWWLHKRWKGGGEPT